MKSNILVQKINLELLDKAIDRYEVETCGNSPKYLIMNTWTRTAMKDDVDSCYFFGDTEYCMAIEKYKGISIAISERLANGEVDLVI